jgi:DASH complex subunit SPC19
LLVDEATVEKYKADLIDEIEPQITELISRTEKGMKALQRKHLALQTKVLDVLFVCRGVSFLSMA